MLDYVWHQLIVIYSDMDFALSKYLLLSFSYALLISVGATRMVYLKRLPNEVEVLMID